MCSTELSKFSFLLRDNLILKQLRQHIVRPFKNLKCATAALLLTILPPPAVKVCDKIGLLLGKTVVDQGEVPK